MSERKRFPPEVIAAGHEVLASLHFACDPDDCEHFGDEGSDGEGYCEADEQQRLVNAVTADHLQAREDVKRLSAELRERLGEACCDRSFMTTGRPFCERCVKAKALLSEVGQ